MEGVWLVIYCGEYVFGWGSIWMIFWFVYLLWGVFEFVKCEVFGLFVVFWGVWWFLVREGWN